MKKISVVLGFMRSELHIWNENWKAGKAANPWPYFYWLANDNNNKVCYVQSTRFERILPFSLLRKVFFYLVHCPYLLYTNDAIWTHFDSDGEILSVLKKILPLTKAKVIARAIWIPQGFDDCNFLSRLYKKIAWSCADAIVVSSRIQVSCIESKFGISKNKLHYIPFGVNLDAYSLSSKCSKPSVIQDFDGEFILALGNDQDRDYRTIAEVARLLPDRTFVFATSNNVFCSYEYPSNVKVFSTDIDGIRWLYKNASLVIIPLLENVHASGCTTAIEAGSMGKPIIATDAGGLDDYICPSLREMMPGISDVKAFVDKISNIIDDKDQLLSLGQEQHNFVSCFTIQKYTNGLLDVTKGCM